MVKTVPVKAECGLHLYTIGELTRSLKKKQKREKSTHS